MKKVDTRTCCFVEVTCHDVANQSCGPCCRRHAKAWKLLWHTVRPSRTSRCKATQKSCEVLEPYGLPGVLAVP